MAGLTGYGVQLGAKGNDSSMNTSIFTYVCGISCCPTSAVGMSGETKIVQGQALDACETPPKYMSRTIFDCAIDVLRNLPSLAKEEYTGP